MGFLWLANDNVPPWVANAKSLPMMQSIGTSLRDALPENLEQEIRKRLGTDDNEKKEGEQDTDQKT